MKYNLNLTREYCSHWTVENAMRELLANTLDEDGVIDVSDLNRLVLLTRKALPIEAFLMGYSVKEKPTSIGQYGEGLKIALLILTRENIPFQLSTTTHDFTFEFETPPEFGTETLHMTITETHHDYTNLQKRLHSTALTCISVDTSNISLGNIYREYPADSLIPNGKGLYSQGLLVEPDFYLRNDSISYGVNVGAGLTMNRDRTFFLDKEKVLAPVLEKLLDPAFFLSYTTSLYRADLFIRFSNNYKQRILHAYALPYNAQSKLAGKTLIMTTSYEDTYYPDPDEEYLIITQHWYEGRYLNPKGASEVMKRLVMIHDSYNDTPTSLSTAKKSKHRKYLLADISKATTPTELVETLLKYVPIVKSQRPDTTDRVMRIYKSLVDNE